MALTVQNVMDDVSFERRKDLDATGGSGDAFDLMLRWVDQTHKDLLHTGIFRHALREQTTVTTTAGTRSYALTPTNVRRIEAVYNRKAEEMLLPISELANPASLADPPDLEGGPRASLKHATSKARPQYFWLETDVAAGVNTHTLFIMPPPLDSTHAGVMDVFFIEQAVTVSAGATTLACGEDGRDAIVAGVLARAYRYERNMELAAYWESRYEAMKMGETVI
jgi:hypothetical protein